MDAETIQKCKEMTIDNDRAAWLSKLAKVVKVHFWVKINLLFLTSVVGILIFMIMLYK
jgi:hypothetical protein